MREKKILESTKLLEPDDFLNRMVYNDPELNEFFSNIQSVDASVENDLDPICSSGDDTNIAQPIDDHVQMDDEPVNILPASPDEEEENIDPTKCIYCIPARKVNLVTSCGHISCDICWNTWVAEQNKLLDKSDEPIRTIRTKRKNPKCMYCSKPTTSTTRMFFPF